jgi:hypothetical protein
LAKESSRAEVPHASAALRVNVLRSCIADFAMHRWVDPKQFSVTRVLISGALSLVLRGVQAVRYVARRFEADRFSAEWSSP